MRKLISCEFNTDTGCVELRYSDKSLLAIDCTAVENQIADNLYQRSGLDYLIYNDPIGYTGLILNGDPELYLKAVTKYKHYEIHYKRKSLKIAELIKSDRSNTYY